MDLVLPKSMQWRRIQRSTRPSRPEFQDLSSLQDCHLHHLSTSAACLVDSNKKARNFKREIGVGERAVGIRLLEYISYICNAERTDKCYN
jgi:hypothetical protein